MSGLVVVVPCYNEERRLDPSAFCQFARDAAGIRFVFVNDGSTDGTVRVLRGLETSDPESFAACALPQNMGKAEAVRQGFLTAFRSQPEYVAFWDADLATPLEIIPSFRDVLDRRPELLLVIGSRMRLLGHRLVRDPLRHLASRIFSHVASWLLGVRIHDTQCGAKMFRATAEVKSLFAERFCTDWIFDVELFARLMRLHGARDPALLKQCVYEHPLDAWREMSGSKIKLPGFAKAVYEMFVLLWNYRIRCTWHGGRQTL